MLNTASLSDRVLLTGSEGFTGKYLSQLLEVKGFDVHHLSSDLLEFESLVDEVLTVSPKYVVHLAGISNVAEKNSSNIYNVNVLGTENLLKAISVLKVSPQKILLASSAAVYGDQGQSILSEDLCPSPNSHYALSKLNMEKLATNFFPNLNILSVRLFNYTGVGQSSDFIIPKLVSAFKNKDSYIELGNLNVSREFNDVRDVVSIYLSLLRAQSSLKVVNVCSARAIPLKYIVDTLNSLAGYEIEIRTNQRLVRKNEIWSLSGSIKELSAIIPVGFKHQINDTLEWMYLN